MINQKNENPVKKINKKIQSSKLKEPCNRSKSQHLTGINKISRALKLNDHFLTLKSKSLLSESWPSKEPSSEKREGRRGTRRRSKTLHSWLGWAEEKGEDRRRRLKEGGG